MNKFRGGVHPPGRKVSGSSKIENAALPPKVVIPLQQHIGAPAQPIVKVGAEVEKGQKIGELGGFVSANVHASISGKVTEISDYLYPNPLGRTALSVVIESDGRDEWDEDIKPSADPDSLDNHKMQDIIKEAGIVGMGGAAFPTHVKFNVPEGKRIDTIILNGVECEPYMTPDHRIMVEEPEKIVDGLRLTMKVTGVNSGIIGIEMNKPDAIQKMKEATNNDDNIRIAPLKAKYPQGWENMLIKAVLGEEVPQGELPIHMGVVVSNVGVALAVSNAVRFGHPLIERVVSVTGSGIAQPKNLRVRIGTPFSDLIEQCGGFKGTVRKIVSGGPMMGFAIFDTDIPIVKSTTNILLFSDKDAEIYEPQSCIRCGRCVSVCPVGLIPTMIASLSAKGKFKEAEAYSPLNCKDCGCCAYACPAKIPLVQLIQLAKSDIMARQKVVKGIVVTVHQESEEDLDEK